MIRAGQADDGTTVELPPGDTLELRLPESPTTGHQWRLRADPPACLTLIKDGFEPGGPALGAPGVRTWRFRAAGPGRGTLELVNERSWQPGGPRFSLTVVVPPG